MTTQLPCPADDKALAAELRVWVDILALWRLCAKPACRRTRECRGDARVCFPRNAGLLPEGVQDWYDGLCEAHDAGTPFDDAVAALNVTDAGHAFRDWHAAVSASLGGNETLPVRWWNAR